MSKKVQNRKYSKAHEHWNCKVLAKPNLAKISSNTAFSALPTTSWP